MLNYSHCLAVVRCQAQGLRVCVYIYSICVFCVSVGECGCNYQQTLCHFTLHEKIYMLGDRSFHIYTATTHAHSFRGLILILTTECQHKRLLNILIPKIKSYLSGCELEFIPCPHPASFHVQNSIISGFSCLTSSCSRC